MTIANLLDDTVKVANCRLENVILTYLVKMAPDFQRNDSIFAHRGNQIKATLNALAKEDGPDLIMS